MLGCALSQLLQFSQTCAALPSLGRFGHNFIKLRGFKFLARVDLFLVVANLVEVRLQSQVVIVSVASLLLALALKSLDRVDHCPSVALTRPQEHLVFRVECLHLWIRSFLTRSL